MVYRVGRVSLHAVSRWSRSPGCCGHISWCVFLVSGGISFFFFRFFFFERTRPTASTRQPCLMYLSTSIPTWLGVHFFSGYHVLYCMYGTTYTVCGTTAAATSHLVHMPRNPRASSCGGSCNRYRAVSWMSYSRELGDSGLPLIISGRYCSLLQRCHLRVRAELQYNIRLFGFPCLWKTSSLRGAHFPAIPLAQRGRARAERSGTTTHGA